MNTKSHVQIWGCMILSAIWANNDTKFGLVLGVIWLAIAIVIAVVELLDFLPPRKAKK